MKSIKVDISKNEFGKSRYNQLLIREKIFKMLFPDYYQEYIYLKCSVDLKDEKIVNQYRPIKKDRYIQVFEAIKRDNVDVISIEKNKKNEWVIVTKRITENEAWVLLYSPTYLACNHHPRIMSSICYDYCTHKKHIRIDDIIMEDDNIGNGSICMKYFIGEVKNLNCGLIHGYLSDVDRDHFDRLIHYYEKFDFDIVLNEKKTDGTIKLNLN